MKEARFFVCLILVLCFLACAVAEKENDLIRSSQVIRGMKKDCTMQEIRCLLDEMKVFPVVDRKKMHFEKSYGDGRSYGGNRRHEGVDIFPEKEKENFYAVVAVADGIVEKIGWLELGGYRIGIRSRQGFYYYYAHLSSYAKGIKKGSAVKAGSMIGYMGNTGYGKEGTKGKFAVHLHFGIYRQVNGLEKSLNPYYLLDEKRG